MKKHALTLLLLLCFISYAQAQRKMQQLDEDEAKKQEQLRAYEGKGKGFDPEKLTYGGNLGGGFSGGYGYFLAQPMVGYRIKPKTTPGLGFTYIYESIKSGGTTFSSSAYGPIFFIRQGIFGNIFAHAEYAPMNYQISQTERIWINQAFIGGGTGGSGAQVYILYNLLHDQTPWNVSPWYIRIGFML